MTSSATQALTLHLRATAETVIRGAVNGLELCLPVSDLARGGRSFYSGGFVSPSFVFHRAVPEAEYRHEFSLTLAGTGERRDWYYARVRCGTGNGLGARQYGSRGGGLRSG